MVIETRYRDIPWEEARKCQSAWGPDAETAWNQVRGAAVKIQIPAINAHADVVVCGGPFFLRAERLHSMSIVCPHIAEIGD